MGARRSRRLPLDLSALGAGEDMFRLSGAVERDSAVASWLSDDAGGLRSICRRWFTQMRKCGEDVRELMHDGCPVACVEDAPFGYVNLFKSHVNVGFFHGAMLEDPARLLAGSGKRMRHVKLKSGGELDAAALKDLIDSAYADIRARLGITRAN